MRELKFRAWDTDDDRMRYDISVTQDGYAESDWGKEKPHWELEQFTGIHDKNGKEIYENDVVMVHSKSYGTYAKAVMYQDKMASFIVSGFPMPKMDGIQIEMPNREWDKPHNPCNCDGALYEGYRALEVTEMQEDGSYRADVEVIGTIHQELMIPEVKKND